jgi:hypothetical protein
MAAPSSTLAAVSLWLLVLLVACVLGGLTIAVWHSVHVRGARSSSASIGCAPNLPNDHCR